MFRKKTRKRIGKPISSAESSGENNEKYEWLAWEWYQQDVINN